ncbi:alcohol dehydrogenase catalytic domain-containing protein, partial [Terribacillus sp. 7520-G]|uniref:alcohol dehydrogenase catalytic domain-containing protein n=1 Tax=Terribacillus sp. 7520-G TaxID=2025389 RepID=UPI000BC4B949
DIKKRKGTKGSGTPGILGLDAVGIIEKLGEDVKDHHVGNRVIVFINTAAYTVANAPLVFPINTTQLLMLTTETCSKYSSHNRVKVKSKAWYFE